MQGNIYPIKMLIDGIKGSPSSDPTALPLRAKGNKYLTGQTNIESRNLNKAHWKKLKKEYLRLLFCKDNLKDQSGKFAGLYFFISSEIIVNKDIPFYYVGISTSNLQDRLNKHLVTKDYYFYMLTYPTLKQKYNNEARLCYFAPGENYTYKGCEYERQYQALDKVSSINSIAWITNPDFEKKGWEFIESFFVRIHQPPANCDKLSDPIEFPPFSNYKDKYEQVKNYLYNTLLNRLKL